MKHKFTHRVPKVTAEQLESYHRFPNTVPAVFAGGKLQDSKKGRSCPWDHLQRFGRLWKKLNPGWKTALINEKRRVTHANSLSYPYCFSKIWDVPKCDTDLYQVLEGVLKENVGLFPCNSNDPHFCNLSGFSQAGENWTYILSVMIKSFFQVPVYSCNLTVVQCLFLMPCNVQCIQKHLLLSLT